ncbi:MAG: methionine synthase [Clostridiales bacterium]|jgi:5-methyltetrahydrofolate--homocysteine methyltransferase|nr:methionine synthase [Clostridiales bacterium]
MINLDKIDKKEALRYLQCSNISPDSSIMGLINECEKKLLKVIEPRYLYSAFDITHTENSVILENCTLELTGNDIRKHLKDCKKAVLFCTTISNGVDKLLRFAQISNMTEALVLDSLASAAIEQVCDEVEKIIHSAYPNFYSTWRFSPGYGDLPITLQAEFLNVLNSSKRIGLSATSSFMLTPSKSVTAIIGLSETPVAQKSRNCSECNLAKACVYRKNGGHCN